jgi:hypothetical protein
MILSHALRAFREEVERGRIDGLEWKFPRAKDGTICMFNVNEFALMDISFRVADVLRTWPDWPATLAWNAAKTRPWQAPENSTSDWLGACSWVVDARVDEGLDASSSHNWLRDGNQLGQFPQILRRRGEEEFVAGAGRTA